jgi:hypothetical protein
LQENAKSLEAHIRRFAHRYCILTGVNRDLSNTHIDRPKK